MNSPDKRDSTFLHIPGGEKPDILDLELAKDLETPSQRNRRLIKEEILDRIELYSTALAYKAYLMHDNGQDRRKSWFSDVYLTCWDLYVGDICCDYGLESKKVKGVLVPDKFVVLTRENHQSPDGITAEYFLKKGQIEKIRLHLSRIENLKLPNYVRKYTIGFVERYFARKSSLSTDGTNTALDLIINLNNNPSLSAKLVFKEFSFSTGYVNSSEFNFEPNLDLFKRYLSPETLQVYHGYRLPDDTDLYKAHFLEFLESLLSFIPRQEIQHIAN